MDTTLKHSHERESGVILLAVMLVGLILGIMVAAFLEAAGNAMHATKMWRQSDIAFTIAISAMEKAKWDIYETFAAEYYSGSDAQKASKFDWFSYYGDSWLGSSNPYNAPQGEAFDDGTVTVMIDSTQRIDKTVVDVLLRSTAELGHSSRTVQEQVRYQLGPAKAFDYAYFVNNYGWLWGSSVTAHGNVRSNADFSFKYDPDINGNAYAAANSDLGAAGEISGTWDHWTLSNYYSNAPAQARPGDPPSDSFAGTWPKGYDASPSAYEGVPILPMPYLGDLDRYKNMANEYSGSLSQKGTKIVTHVYDGAGPDGISGSADDGMLVLEGTAKEPLQIDGPVVVTGDVAIKGYVTGQGTLYSGRNIHIAGPIIYMDPPIWPKPDSNPSDTVTDNADADMLGLAAKGNIILGDYNDSTWYNTVDSYIQPSFTKAYETDPHDADIGYDSDGDSSTGYLFDGDYTAKDGGSRLDASGNTVDRHYYQSSNDRAFATLSPTNDIQQVDAVCYTNHLFGGSTHEVSFNGSVVARDEAIIYQDYINLTWDIRLASPLYENLQEHFALPQTLKIPETLYWREL